MLSAPPLAEAPTATAGTSVDGGGWAPGSATLRRNQSELTTQELPLWVRSDAFPAVLANGRYLRIPAGWCRRQAVVANWNNRRIGRRALEVIGALLPRE